MNFYMTAGKTLMQVENEKRKIFRKALSLIVALPVLGVGIVLLYFGYSEPDYLYLFLYVALGLTVTLLGFMMLFGGLPGRTSKVAADKFAADKPEDEKKFRAPLSKCPACDSTITSAGKFCGNCGKALD